MGMFLFMRGSEECPYDTVSVVEYLIDMAGRVL